MLWNGGNIRLREKEYSRALSTNEPVRFWILAEGLPQQAETKCIDDVANDGCAVEVDH